MSTLRVDSLDSLDNFKHIDVKDIVVAPETLVNLGAYVVGLVVDDYDKVFEYEGVKYRANTLSANMPYVTTGVWATDSTFFIPIGDSDLREDFNEAQLRSSVPGVVALSAFPSFDSGARLELLGYHESTPGLGGGALYWSPTTPKSSHDGGTVFSPTVPWDGELSTHEDYLNGVGETSPGGMGAYVRKKVGSGELLSSFGALPDEEHGYIINVAVTKVIGSRLTFDVPTGVISTQVNLPDVITLDFTGTTYNLGGDQDYYIYADGTDQMHVIRPNFIDATDFALRTKYHRAIRAENVRLVTVVKPIIDGASTGIHALFCGTFISDHVELRNIKGTAAQSGYGMNTSADSTFIDSINFDNTNSVGHGRHALYINGPAKNTHVGTLRVKGCVYNPVNVAIDENIVGTINLDYCDFTDCNTSPLSNRVGCVHLTAQGAGTFGPNDVVFTSRVIKSVGSAGGAFTIGQYGYHGSRVGKIISRSPLDSAGTGMALVHTRFAVNVEIDEIDADSLPNAGGTSYVAEFRDSVGTRVNTVRIGGAVGAAAVHIFDTTSAVVGDIFSTIPTVLVSGTSTWSRAAKDTAFYLVGGGTPSTGGKRNLYTTAAGLNITNFLDGNDGDIINIISMAGTTTITYNAALIVTKTGANVVLGVRGSMQLIKRGSVWVEI